MRGYWLWIKLWLKLGAGWGFVALGVLGLFLPILQGFLFLAIGFSILSTKSPWAQRQLERMRRRHPALAATFDTARARAAGIVKRRKDGGADDDTTG